LCSISDKVVVFLFRATELLGHRFFVQDSLSGLALKTPSSVLPIVFIEQ
jgi:hypothetical protein